jgi:hypothetical protein
MKSLYIIQRKEEEILDSTLYATLLPTYMPKFIHTIQFHLNEKEMIYKLEASINCWTLVHTEVA